MVAALALMSSPASSLVRADQYDYDNYEGGGGSGDYGSDSLYHDYAMRQQDKDVGKS